MDDVRHGSGRSIRLCRLLFRAAFLDVVSFTRRAAFRHHDSVHPFRVLDRDIRATGKARPDPWGLCDRPVAGFCLRTLALFAGRQPGIPSIRDYLRFDHDGSHPGSRSTQGKPEDRQGPDRYALHRLYLDGADGDGRRPGFRRRRNRRPPARNGGARLGGSTFRVGNLRDGTPAYGASNPRALRHYAGGCGAGVRPHSKKCEPLRRRSPAVSRARSSSTALVLANSRVSKSSPGESCR